MFAQEITAYGWTVLPSLANFVFTRKEGLSGKSIYEAIKREGILVRHFSQPGIEDFVRISIGTPEQMKKLSGVMKGV